MSTKPEDESRLFYGRTRKKTTFAVAPPLASLPESYAATLHEIKSLLRGAPIRATLSADPIVVEAWCNPGKIIIARQQKAAREFLEGPIAQQPVAQLPC
jgi:hypothetical protein